MNKMQKRPYLPRGNFVWWGVPVILFSNNTGIIKYSNMRLAGVT